MAGENPLQLCKKQSASLGKNRNCAKIRREMPVTVSGFLTHRGACGDARLNCGGITNIIFVRGIKNAAGFFNFYVPLFAAERTFYEYKNFKAT